MANVFVDGELTTGANNGTSWVNARQGAAGLQAACDAAAAGDILNLVRTFTLAATIDIDINDGTRDNLIRVIGYNYNNGDPIVNGTFAVLDGNSAATNCILGNNKDNWTWENIEFKNANEDNVGISGATDCDHWQFINCHSHDAGKGAVTGDGWGSGAGGGEYDIVSFVPSKAYSNLTYGFDVEDAYIFGCSAYSNGLDGYYIYFSSCSNCLAYSNSGNGFSLYGNEQTLVNCVSDNNAGVGVYADDGPLMLVGCRITNNAVAISGNAVNSSVVLDLFNFIKGNTVISANANIISTVRGKNTRMVTGEEGYIDKQNGNYGTSDRATGRRTEIPF